MNRAHLLIGLNHLLYIPAQNKGPRQKLNVSEKRQLIGKGAGGGGLGVESMVNFSLGLGDVDFYQIHL